jgi:hypothetical protein
VIGTCRISRGSAAGIHLGRSADTSAPGLALTMVLTELGIQHGEEIRQHSREQWPSGDSSAHLEAHSCKGSPATTWRTSRRRNADIRRRRTRP